MAKIYKLAFITFLFFSSLLKAQVSQYSFSQSTGVFSTITVGAGSATVIGGSTDDNQVFGPMNIGFPFFYNGVCYTQFGLGTNGFISLGAVAPITSYSPISMPGAANNVISAFSNDLVMGFRTTVKTINGTNTATVASVAGISVGNQIPNGTYFPNGTTVVSISGNTITSSANATVSVNNAALNFSNGQKSYQTLGAAPNRTLVVQWLKARKAANINDCFNFQIRLMETTNEVAIIYGAITNNNVQSTYEVGLKGNNSLDYNSRTTTTNWLATSTSTLNTNWCVVNNTIIPTDGLTFLWTPPVSSIAGNTLVCGTNTNVFVSPVADSYSWSTGSTLQFISVSPAIATTYTLVRTYTAGCTFTNTITTSNAPNPTVTITGPSTLCSGQSINLTANGATSYSWNTGALTATVGVSPLVNVSYIAYGASGGCTTNAVQDVTVVTLPTLTVTGNQTVCSGQPVILTAIGADSYVWNNGALTSTNSVSPIVNSTYTVTGTSSLSGCSSNTSYSVAAAALPNLVITGNSTVCIGSSTILYGAGAITYSWSTGSPFPYITVTPTANTSYSVIGTAANGCSTSATQSVSLVSLPSVSLSVSNSTVCVNTTTVDLIGFPSGGVYSGSNVSGNVFTPFTVGTFTPTYVYTSTLTGCTNSASTNIEVTICTDLKERFENIQMVIFPNPTNGFITLNYGMAFSKLEILDLNGNLLLSQNLEEQKMTIDLTEFSSGIYIARVSGSAVSPLIKKIIKN